MRYLIRKLIRRDESIDHRDSSFDGDVITVGRSTDQVITVADKRCALNHATIRKVGDYLQVRTSAQSGMRINRKRTDYAQLSVGDVIEIAGTKIEIIASEAGFDAALKVEPGLVDPLAQRPGYQYKTDLEQTTLTRRRLSWILAIGSLILGLGVPIFASLEPTSGELLRKASFLPSDELWLSGPLHGSHKNIADCTQCHDEPFAVVKDEQCVTCHFQMNNHVIDAIHVVPELEDTRCATCHKEHNEPNNLVRQDQFICSDCHTNLEQKTAAVTDLKDATDFGYNHPNLSVSPYWMVGDIPKELEPELLNEQGRIQNGSVWETNPTLRVDKMNLNVSGMNLDDNCRDPYIQGYKLWCSSRLSLDKRDQLKEKSNLTFPHNEHMKDEGLTSPEDNTIGVRLPDGKSRLTCGDCHTPETGGQLMETINMEQHCRGCHILEFDPNAVDDRGRPRQVPHGEPEVVVQTLVEYYSRSFLDNTIFKNTSSASRRGSRRIREEALTNEEREQALELAKEKAMQVAADLFEQQACKTCHEINVKESVSDVKMNKWVVDPVLITRKWQPLAYFDHAKHRTYECDDCHAARVSEESSDILIPDINNCRQCHAGVDSQKETDLGVPNTIDAALSGTGLLASNCIECHRFHLPKRGLMKQDIFAELAEENRINVNQIENLLDKRLLDSDIEEKMCQKGVLPKRLKCEKSQE